MSISAVSDSILIFHVYRPKQPTEKTLKQLLKKPEIIQGMNGEYKKYLLEIGKKQESSQKHEETRNASKKQKKIIHKIIQSLLEKEMFKENEQPVSSGHIQKKQRVHHGYELTC